MLKKWFYLPNDNCKSNATIGEQTEENQKDVSDGTHICIGVCAARSDV